ncbi:MAG TPA: hypothetical protein VJZ78_03685 [Anaerolineales bacterium]|nr:hypothetical protein [Anaerolineales bacterium]
MKQDRFLQGILIFIFLLVVIALGIFIMRGNDQSYGPDDSPEGVVRNYALALQNMDFERAYKYLADDNHKPDYETFRYSFLNQRLDTINISLQIGEIRSSGTNEAYVEVAVIYNSGDIFSSPNATGEIASLIRQSQGWKITSMPYPYWGWDWYQPKNPTNQP